MAVNMSLCVNVRWSCVGHLERENTRRSETTMLLPGCDQK